MTRGAIDLAQVPAEGHLVLGLEMEPAKHEHAVRLERIEDVDRRADRVAGHPGTVDAVRPRPRSSR